MPRGPGKKENYNLDYSRFNAFDRDEAEVEDQVAATQQEEADAAGGLPVDVMREAMARAPPELREAYHLMSVARETGDEKAQKRANELAIQAVERGGPEVKNAFMENLAQMQPELQPQLSKDMDPKNLLDGFPKQAQKTEATEDLDDTSERIDKLREQMLEGQKATRNELDMLAKKQEELENVRSPEEFFKFMTSEGMTQEDLQRMLTGDEAHMKTRFEDTMKAKENEKKKFSDEALKKVDEVHAALTGKPMQEEAPEPAPEKPVRKPRREEPKEPEVVVPMYRLQYQKDEAGKYTAVELKCNLPGVADMSAINLDVSERHLRLSTIAPAPRYAVNAGPFPVLIDPSGARAKYSKKREELSICVPAKLD
jgi:hypothetical protein